MAPNVGSYFFLSNKLIIHYNIYGTSNVKLIEHKFLKSGHSIMECDTDTEKKHNCLYNERLDKYLEIS